MKPETPRGDLHRGAFRFESDADVPHVFINPDGTVQHGMFVVIFAKTGVTYGHQCAGLVNEVRSCEGYLVPVGNEDQHQALQRWTHQHLCNGSVWRFSSSSAEAEELENLVAAIPCWHTELEPGEGDRWAHLTLDESHIGETTEGWVPVITVEGPGILLFANCD